MAQVVIIGAGLTGISAAYHLEQKKFFDYKIFEKESGPGGLCRSIMQDGFTFDYTGHLLHINDPYVHSLIQKIIGFDQFNVINRRSFIYSHHTYTPYPYQINLFGLPPQTIVDCITGFVRRTPNPNSRTFREWVLSKFGTGFGKHFFFPYQEKIFAYNIDKLTASWTQRFVPDTSLEQILFGSLHDSSTTSVGYNAQFFYPKQGGIFSWVNQFAQQLRNPIQTDFCVQHIDLRNKTVTFTNGHSERYETLISTLPLDTFLHSIKERSSDSLKRAHDKLLCNQVVNFNIGVNHDQLSDKHWIYFPENEYPFYRIGFPHNFTSSAAPHGMSSLYGEFAHLKKPASWVSDTLDASIKKTCSLLKITDQNIATKAIINISHAYVIYDQWRDRYVPRLLVRLKEQRVHSIGRYGAWKYSSMQEAILDGKQTAENIIMIPARKDTEIYSPGPSKIQEISHE